VNPAEPGVVTGPDGQPLPPYEPAPLSSRKLLGYQYRNSVRDLLGPKAAEALKVSADARINGQASVAASQLSYSATSIDALEKNAFAAAQAALADAAQKTKLIPCKPAGAQDEACLAKVIEPLGRRFFRRALTAEEKAAYLALAKDAAQAYNAFDSGVEFAVAAFLQSPHFLYTHEIGDGQAVSRLNGLEVATKLSFFLTASTPSDELLSAAEMGELDSEPGIRAFSERLIAEQPARVESALNSFWGEYFDLNALADLSKDTTLVADFDAALKADMEQETLLSMRDVVFEGEGDLRKVFTTDSTYLTARLAKFYGIDGVTSTTPTKVAMSGKRVGIFSNGAWLSTQAHKTSVSPTYRGKFLREKVLCEAVDAPPPDVSTTLPPVAAGTNPTFRERISSATAAPRCRGCHRLMDDIGFAFEGFDLAGRSQATDNGKPVDVSGNLDGEKFNGVAELSKVLINDERSASCMSRALNRTALGRIELESEARPVATLVTRFTTQGQSVKKLLVDIVTSEPFRVGLKP
jgi:hypothetical protein